MALFVKVVVLKRNYLRLIGAESEHLEGKSTTPHHLVNSNKVCKNIHFLINNLMNSAGIWQIPIFYSADQYCVTTFLKQVAGFIFKAAKTIVYMTNSENRKAL
ncbi:hypothetical protein P8767_02700 [Peribacillus frigoritolerans]|nr:hypothetical protein [Peribacillus frigoritolerans]